MDLTGSWYGVIAGLVTLSDGVSGSLLSIGSAKSEALMGPALGIFTFFAGYSVAESGIRI